MSCRTYPYFSSINVYTNTQAHAFAYHTDQIESLLNIAKIQINWIIIKTGQSIMNCSYPILQLGMKDFVEGRYKFLENKLIGHAAGK